jgi:hypothetical protein
VNNPLDVKESDEHTLAFALNLSRCFGLSEFGLSVHGSCSLLRRLVYLLPLSPSHFSRDLHKL